MDLSPTEGNLKLPLGVFTSALREALSPLLSRRAEAGFNSLNPKSGAVSCVHLGSCSIETLFWQVYSQ